MMDAKQSNSQIPNLHREFVTPIVKATRNRETLHFFTMTEYESWKASNPGKGWSIKYYKGLGTNTPNEAKAYFRSLARHEIDFFYSGDQVLSDFHFAAIRCWSVPHSSLCGFPCQ